VLRRTALAAALPASLAALLAACGQDHGPAPAPSASSTTAANAAGSSSAAPSAAPSGSTASLAADAGAPADAGDDAAPGAPSGPAPDGMIEIPAGIFLMGSPGSTGLPEEHPQHEVAIARFYLDRTEVTTGAYKKCVEGGKCKTTHQTAFCNEPHTDRDDHPINCVDYHMAEAYCAAVGKRLPTEREWEYAARGGAEQRAFSWGEEPPSPANACYMHGESCPVKSFAPGAFGLYDISGNVWEWTSSWFGPYPNEPATGTHKVYRGGSWSRRFPKWLRNGIRNRYLPDEFSASVGFRCAKSAEPTTCPKDHAPKDGACVRTSGQPWCEPGHPWNGKECGGYDTNKAPDKTAEDLANEPVVKTRTPQFDDDCQAHYKGKPAAYRFSGSTFHARNPMINAGGCSRRDMGQTWTSACCPG
jgi:formylglycine-generating enzyme required for sulfatase activity